MIEFSLAYALAVIFLSSFLPGALLSLALLKKSDFSLLEKILAGFALGWIVQAFIPFFEFLVLGINFSYSLALLNTGIFYALSISLFIILKAYEDEELRFPDPNEILKEPAKYMIPAFVLLIFFLNFFVRIQSLSPIYQELDPYYYIYGAQQIATLGYNPLDDKTAWYPTVKVDHRWAPLKTYLEASWYVLYSQGGQYNNYILSLISNIYPPFAAAFAGFFVYLGLRAWYRKEYALIASVLASFIPIFILKTMAGGAEVQPYAFFAFSFFIAFFLWAQKKQDLKYMALAGIGYFALSSGSSSQVIGSTLFLLFTIPQAITLFLMKKEIGSFVRLSAAFLLFSLLATVLKSAFSGYPIISYAFAEGCAVAFTFVLFLVQKSKLDHETQLYALGALAFAAALLFAFTPLGDLVKDVALTGLQIARYNAPLDRTIAEQSTSSAIFEPQLGWMGKIFGYSFYPVIGVAFAGPSELANAAFSLFSLFLNAVFDINLNYSAKENSVLMAVLFFSLAASAYGAYRMAVNKEENPAWFFLALIFPIALIGLLKAKYVIYLGFVLSMALAFVFGEFEDLVLRHKQIFVALAASMVALGVLMVLFSGDAASALLGAGLYGALMLGLGRFGIDAFKALLATGLILALLQTTGLDAVTDEGGKLKLQAASPTVSLIKASFGIRFQDNPAALEQKFAGLCDQLQLKGASGALVLDVCAAGKDAIAYANKSTNNQYNSNLCFLSLMKDPFDPNEDKTGAAYRCERISDYWIESMEWIRYNTENDSRITSWWDYGHWENFFGQRNAVIRNEHASHEMIGEIAHNYLSGTPEELRKSMLRYDSRYALFDAELLMSGNSFGGKYGALNYLACARNNLTNVGKSPGSSLCEFEHLWSQIYVPLSPSPQDSCTISFSQKGITAYAAKPVESTERLDYQLEPVYCLGATTLADGKNTSALYDLRNRSPDGTLKLHKAFVKFEGTTSDRRWNLYTLLYTKDKIWLENNNISDGWSDRSSKFYDSNLYSAFVLEDLPGFELVYKTSDGMVKIYRIKD